LLAIKVPAWGQRGEAQRELLLEQPVGLSHAKHCTEIALDIAPILCADQAAMRLKLIEIRVECLAP
jgi:hypothetical protein